MIQYDKVWDNPILYSDGYYNSKFYSNASYVQYMHSMHTSLLCLIGTDVIPFRTLGNLTSAVMLSFGLFIVGNILGTFAEIVYELNEIGIMS